MITAPTLELKLELQQIPPATIGVIEPLEVPIEWTRYCEICDSEQRFIAYWRCANGLLCHCVACHDTRVAPYTRSNTVVEAATTI